jgi:acetamidase/formamidase
MLEHRLLILGALAASPQPLAAQHFHRLPATPGTVAYGYYSAAAPPVLRIASGNTIEVETLITNRPDRLEAAGVAPADVQQSLRDIVAQITDRGPGGHFIAMGMDKDLTTATQIAVQQAIDFVAAYLGWSKMEAYRLVSVACDVRITELVDGNVGVHVMIPKAIVRK